MIRSLLGLLFGVALFSAGYAAPPQYPEHAEATKAVVTVRVIWLKSYEQTTTFCSFLARHPIEPGWQILGCYEPMTSTIFAVQPKNFNDARALEVLGHEFWHALGAEHPEIPSVK